MSVISGVVGAITGSDASRSAANTTADASNRASDLTAEAAKQAIEEQRRQYEQGRADMAPWRETGGNALAQLVGKINAGPGDYTKSPGYDFRLSEGNKALERSAAARGNVLGAGTLKALNRYGQDYATADYDNFLRRYYESLTPLQSLSGVGQSTASQTAGAGAQAASGIANTTMAGALGSGNALMAGANAIAGGQINSANAITGASRSGSGNALQAYQLWKMTQKGNNPGLTNDVITYEGEGLPLYEW